MQETWVRSLGREDPMCHRATKPVCHDYWACALEPWSHNYWAHVLQPLKPTCPRSHAPQQEKLLQREVHATQVESSPRSLQLEKSPCSNEDSAQTKINKQKCILKTGCFKRTASKHVYYQGWNRLLAQVGCMRQALGPGALGGPGGSGWGGWWEGGSGWGRHVNPRPFHFNVWQNSLQMKKNNNLTSCTGMERGLWWV